MPIYEYQCESCGQIMEVFSPTSQRDITYVECGTCELPMKLIMSASNFVLKGGGWAKDGYGRNPPEKPPKKAPT